MFHLKLGPARLLPVLALALGAVSVSCDNPEAIRDLLEKLGKGGGGARTCGGAGGATCGPREFCDLGKGSCAAGGVGVCQTKPEVCDTIFAPVCGCDGKTYGNDCERQAAGVSKAKDGECLPQRIEVGEGEQCMGFTPPPLRVCKPGLFCMPPPKTCGAADVPGVCEVTPTACTKEFRPVCGCDGRTYGNDCARRAAKIALDHVGACEGGGGGEGAVCDTIVGLPCNKGLFCEHDPNTCNVADGGGKCTRQPTVCTAIFKPVCGCDGTTYSNDCARQAAGVSKDHDGACTPPRGGEGALCDGIAGFPCNKGLFCDHPPGTCKVADGAGKCTKQPEACTLQYAPVCGCDGKTYGNDCARAGAGVSKDHDGECK